MPHSLNKIWIHAIWSTKERAPFISNTAEKKVHHLVSQELHEQGCLVRIINGMPDHIHCLFLLNPRKSLADVIKHVKGISSHIINQNNFIVEKFAWQSGYAAYSISENRVEKVYQYIKYQKQHHLKKTYQQEYEEILNHHQLVKIEPNSIHPFPA